ncbi:MAG: hypothetical protein ABFD97_17530 [Syntrophobacter sp.]
MHDINHHGQHHHREGEGHMPELDKLRKMAEYWVNHNEEHARSYRLWADRAREAGQGESARLLEDLAEDMALHNGKLRMIAALIDSKSQSD